ncbi:uncharacterized protein LOC120276529 [Dioscorea cayenensis subsp. rotundata]|uniref:Uncharacterized protein LOC120276529 n=1 Tax=Dioscorea cayennensis subsp. rotundata TaxID=55577 RepID=A0AB40CII3_DIOCR|nr:uncharacterized protein LOC120276529 [Dioscorea cayenensis subsp. rotundata]
MIEHRDRLEAKLGHKVSIVEDFKEVYQKDDGSWNEQGAQLAHEKFAKARQDILAQEGQGVEIDDNKLWWDIFGVSKNRCYGMGGNLVEKIASDYSHLQSQWCTSRTQQFVPSIPPEVISKLEILKKAYEEQKQQIQYIFSLLESRGIQVNFEITPRTSHAAARTGESASHAPHTSEDVEQPQPVDEIATK